MVRDGVPYWLSSGVVLVPNCARYLFGVGGIAPIALLLGVLYRNIFSVRSLGLYADPR